MKFSLSNTEAKVSSVNPRAELHGEDPKPACDVNLEFALSNDELAQLHPNLKGLLYVKDEDRPDLLSQADPGHATMLRFPQLGRLKWDGEVIGAGVTFHYGTTEKSHINLTGCIVGKIGLQPMEGGSVVLGLQVQAHPDEKQFGKLCTLVGSKIPITITPPESNDAFANSANDAPAKDPVLLERTKDGDKVAA
jgi:hypothetical protein